MMTLTEIEDAITALSDEDRAALRAWLEQEAAEDEWDEQIARDAAAGKLDRFIEEARAEHRAGLTREL